MAGSVRVAINAQVEFRQSWGRESVLGCVGDAGYVVDRVASDHTVSGGARLEIRFVPQPSKHAA